MEEIDNNNRSILSCGHALCTTCVIDYARRLGGDGFKCPFCRKLIVEENREAVDHRSTTQDDLMGAIISNIMLNVRIMEENAIRNPTPEIPMYRHVVAKERSRWISQVNYDDLIDHGSEVMCSYIAKKGVNQGLVCSSTRIRGYKEGHPRCAECIKRKNL